MKTLFASFVIMAACAPASYPVTVTMKPAANTFSGQGKCRVAVGALEFDAGAKWGGKSEADFVATLSQDAQQSHKNDLALTSGEWIAQVKLNERDYIGDKGQVLIAPAGNEPFVLTSKVVAVGVPDGVLTVIHEVYAMPEKTKVAEFVVAAGNVGFGLGNRMKNATIPQAMGMLSYFRDRFACNSPAKVVD